MLLLIYLSYWSVAMLWVLCCPNNPQRAQIGVLLNNLIFKTKKFNRFVMNSTESFILQILSEDALIYRITIKICNLRMIYWIFRTFIVFEIKSIFKTRIAKCMSALSEYNWFFSGVIKRLAANTTVKSFHYN